MSVETFHMHLTIGIMTITNIYVSFFLSEQVILSAYVIPLILVIDLNFVKQLSYCYNNIYTWFNKGNILDQLTKGNLESTKTI